MSVKSSQIKLNYPNKVLGALVTAVNGTEYWPFANGANDQWYEGSNSPRYYRWEMTFTVTPQEHGSHLTRQAFVYNALDVVVGDWIASSNDGRCLKIISILSKTRTTVTAVVEDWLRYNTFKNPTGNGAIGTGAAIIFSLNEHGYPMIDPLPTTASSHFYATVMSRFQYLNPQMNYVLEQENHGFVKGDVVAVTANGYVRASAATADKMIGVVTEAGPGPNHFIILPNNRIIDIDPDIPGSQGEFIYVDPTTGRLTNVNMPGGRIIYLSVRGPVPTILTGTVTNPVMPDGYSVAINGEVITFSGTGGISTLTQMINQINVYSSTTEVVASDAQMPSIATSNSAGTAYGLVGGYVPFSATINSGSGATLINFTSAGSVYPGVATPEDMAFDINAAGIPNLVASATETVLTIKELNGNTISIANGLPDTGGHYFVGSSNISGLPAITPGNTGRTLRLSRADGGEVLVFEDSDVFFTNTGITSGHTGVMPLAMNIEQGVRTGGITVVPDLAARDTLQPAAGDMAYVINKGDGEWGLYLYTGSEWVITGTYDSASTDAKTLTVEYTLPIATNPSVLTLGNISPSRKITTISVEVVDALTGHSSTPTVTVGTDVDQALFLDENSTDLTDPTTYFSFPEYVYDSNETQDMVVKSWLTHNGAVSGNIVVKVTYI